MNTFGARVKYARVKLRKLNGKNPFTQKELAVLSGLSQQTIGKIESSSISKTKRIVELANALEVAVDWLVLGGADPVVMEATSGGSANAVDAQSAASSSSANRGSLPVLAVVSSEMENSKVVDDLSLGVIDWAFSGSGLKNIYAVYVHGMSMCPAFNHKDIAIVSTSLLYGANDIVVIRYKATEGNRVGARLVQYCRKEGSAIIFKDIDPGVEDSIDEDAVIAIHKVLNHAEIATL